MAFHLVWDFDHSLITCNSDEAIPLHFSPHYLTAIKEGSLKGIQWTTLMAQVAKDMHRDGITRQQIMDAAGGVSVDTHTLALIKSLPQSTCKQYILSDANAVYIQSFLSAHDLTALFSERVVTNPAHFSEDGCLVIRPFTPPSTPHGCPRCPVNLCKGAVLSGWGLATSGSILYVGDGGGDYCPAMSMPSTGVVFAREGFPLASKCAANPPRAKVVVWSTWKDLCEKIISHCT